MDSSPVHTNMARSQWTWINSAQSQLKSAPRSTWRQARSCNTLLPRAAPRSCATGVLNYFPIIWALHRDRSCENALSQLGSDALLSACTAAPRLTLTESSVSVLIRFLISSLFINYTWAQPLPEVLPLAGEDSCVLHSVPTITAKWVLPWWVQTFVMFKARLWYVWLQITIQKMKQSEITPFLHSSKHSSHDTWVSISSLLWLFAF